MTAVAAAGGSAAPGTLSFLVIAGMAVVLIFVFRSLVKHLRKVTGPARPGERAEPDAGQAAATARDPGLPGDARRSGAG